MLIQMLPKERRNTVLDEMYEDKNISKEEYEQAKNGMMYQMAFFHLRRRKLAMSHT